MEMSQHCCHSKHLWGWGGSPGLQEKEVATRTSHCHQHLPWVGMSLPGHSVPARVQCPKELELGGELAGKQRQELWWDLPHGNPTCNQALAQPWCQCPLSTPTSSLCAEYKFCLTKIVLWYQKGYSDKRGEPCGHSSANQESQLSRGRQVSWDCHFFEKEVDWALMAGTGLEQEKRETRPVV